MKVLVMDGNYIKELPKNIFSSLGLNHLQKNTFSDLKILKEINLQGNNITLLPTQSFQGNDGLRTLVLADNDIGR